jgi:hypothetical protein
MGWEITRGIKVPSSRRWFGRTINLIGMFALLLYMLRIGESE